MKLNFKNYLLSKQGIFLPDISEGYLHRDAITHYNYIIAHSNYMIAHVMLII